MNNQPIFYEHFKKVIGGKRYDNKTAKYISSYEEINGSFSDFSEDLYLKKTGEFFLVGRGNAASKYAGKCGDLSCPGEKIIPLSIDEAKNWIEKFDNDLYEELFEIEDEDQRAYSFLMPESLFSKLTIISNNQGCSMKDIVVEACEEYVGKFSKFYFERYSY